MNYIKSPILKSAIESFEHGLAHFIDNKPVDRKFSILHIDQAVELILKEKLVLMGEDIHKGNGESLNLHETFTKLDRRNIKISEKPRIKEVHDIRNMVQHKGFTPDKESTEYYINQEYDFIKRFLKEEMKIDISDIIDFKIVAFFEKYEPLPLERQIKNAHSQINSNPSGALIDIFKSLEQVISEEYPNYDVNSAINQLKERNLISSYDYNRFSDVFQLRNKVIHTLHEPSLDETKNAVEIISNIIKTINSETEKPVTMAQFKEMITFYLDDKEKKYSPKTIKSYSLILNQFHDYLKIEKDVYSQKDLLKSFKKYLDYLYNEKKLSQNYIHLITQVVKNFFKFCGITALDGFETPKLIKLDHNLLNKQEIKDLLKSPNESTYKLSNIRDKAILGLLYSSGLKSSEIIKLCVDNLDLDNKSIKLDKKDRNNKFLHFSENTKRLLEEYLEKRSEKSEYIFINRFGDPISTRYIQSMVKKYSNIAGITKKVTPHTIKLSFESHISNIGADFIQEYLDEFD